MKRIDTIVAKILSRGYSKYSIPARLDTKRLILGQVKQQELGGILRLYPQFVFTSNRQTIARSEFGVIHFQLTGH